MSKSIDALNRLQSLQTEGDPVDLPEATLSDVTDQEIVDSTSTEDHPVHQGHCETPVNPASQSMELKPQAWFEIIHKEYLQSFVRMGGATIKFVVIPGGEDSTKMFATHLGNLAQRESFIFAKVDARYTKAHMVDRLFYKIARQLDWDELAYYFVVHVLVENGYHVPENRKEFTLRKVAELNERKEPLLRRDLQTWLEQKIDNDPHLCREFRMAMLRICLAQLDAGDSDLVLAQSVKEWLCGDLRLVTGVKKALIFQKIARHNARHMLASLTHWLRITGKGGLVISLDISRYLISKRSIDQDPTMYYGPSSVLDLYDMLRQFIDTADDIEGLMMVVTTPPEFLTDSRRGLDRYEALKLRIWDDVRDKCQQNPLASLVRLSSDEESFEDTQQIELSRDQETKEEAVVPRRIIESLRSGVPNRYVVDALGCPQTEIEARFRRLLEATQQHATAGQCPKGMVIEGGFGSGKSHVIEHLQHLALEKNFICSRVVIGKETPLYNPARLFHAAIESAVNPLKKGEILSTIMEECDVWSPRYKEFSSWINNPECHMDSRFAATLFLYERIGTEQELGHRMTRFWTGDPIGVGELKKYLKECGAAGRFTFEKLSVKDLALQRFQFAARLMQAAGYAGWILLVDEAELIGRYSLRQRAKSYAELARFLTHEESSAFRGLGVVAALTNDFTKEVLEGKNDTVNVPARLRSTQSEADGQLACQAELGMGLIKSERTPVENPTEPTVQEAYRTIRALHFQAHNWRDWDHAAIEPSVSLVPGASIREYVKSWITEWDFKRLIPDKDVEIEVTAFKHEYREDKELQSSEPEKNESEPSTEELALTTTLDPISDQTVVSEAARPSSGISPS